MKANYLEREVAPSRWCVARWDTDRRRPFGFLAVERARLHTAAPDFKEKRLFRHRCSRVHWRETGRFGLGQQLQVQTSSRSKRVDGGPNVISKVLATQKQTSSSVVLLVDANLGFGVSSCGDSATCWDSVTERTREKRRKCEREQKEKVDICNEKPLGDLGDD